MVERPVDFIAQANGETESAQGANIQSDIRRGSGAAMRAEVVAVNGVAVHLDAVEELRVLAQGFAAANGGLIAFNGMAVREDGRPVAIKDEEVGVTPVCEGRIGLAAERLPRGGEPSPGPFPGIEVPVELLGSERAIVVCKRDRRRSETGGQRCARGERQIAVIAVRNEAGRKVTGEGELFAPPARCVGQVARAAGWFRSYRRRCGAGTRTIPARE